MPRKRRKPLQLHPRGLFQFTERTTSVDVSKVLHGSTRDRVTLHVGRSRGALEYAQAGRPAVEIDAARVLEILEAENARRATDRNVGPQDRHPVQVDAAVLAHLRLTARKSTLAGLSEGPFAGRPRQCYETTGKHPGEALWIDTETGDAAIEKTVASPKQGLPPTRKFRPVDAKKALEWLRDDEAGFYPKVLVARSGGIPTLRDILDRQPPD